MTGMSATEVRSRLDHPVVDIDGHTVEFFPALAGELVKEGVRLDGESMLRRTSGTFGPIVDWYGLSPEERADRRVARGPWGNGGMELAVDRATAMLPRLLHERLPELGIDLSVIYPSFGLLFGHFDDERDRRGACRALNRFNAGVFAEFSDRLLPVAEIPMHTPAEAVDELEHAASLGFRAVVMAGFVQRPIAAAAAVDPQLAQYAVWTDTFGLDSAYDYDPVWQKCRELGIAPAFHSSAMGWQNRASISSYVYNHVGMLGESHHALAKSLFLGGVTRRFPDLNFGFLEGGVAWAASLYADLIGHCEKRSGAAMRRLDPDERRLGRVRRPLREVRRRLGGDGARSPPRTPNRTSRCSTSSPPCGIERAEDIRELFVGAVLLRLRGRRPDDRHRVQHQGQPVRRPLQRDVRIRHLALGRPGHGRRARRGVRDGRARPRSPTPTSATSCSPTRCASTRAATPSSSPAPSSRTPSPRILQS